MYRIMIVDDEKLIRKGLRETIDWKSLGFSVEAEASNGNQALEILASNNIDVIIVDIRMPGMSGLELIEKVAKEHKDVYFVILTGYEDFTYAKKAIDFGVKRYLLKPVSDEEIFQTFTDLKIEIDNNKKKEQEYNDIKNELNRISELYKQVIASLNRTGSVTGDMSTNNNGVCELQVEFDKSRFLPIFDLLKQLTCYIKDGNAKKAEIIINDLLNDLKVQDLNSAKQICLDIISVMVQNFDDFYEKIWTLCGERQLPVYRIHEFHDIESMLKWLGGILLFTVKYIDANEKNSIKSSIERAKEYIDEHFQEDLNIADMANFACVSTSYFSSMFKKVTGMTFTDYLTSLRMAKAKELMIKGDMKITEIAKQVGYNDYRSFHKAFRKEFNSAPGSALKNIDK